jgi:hypothetical protein
VNKERRTQKAGLAPIGRAFAYGLAAADDLGVLRALEILHVDVNRT